MRLYNHLNKKNIKTMKYGFTLVELVVVITMLSFLIISVLFIINQSKTIQRSRDAQRKSDLLQLRTSIYTYYHDKNCFPLSIDDIVPEYIQKIPVDPLHKNNIYNAYIYQRENSLCPQWAIFYAKLESEDISIVNNCLIKEICPTPDDINIGSNNYCIIAGSLNCDQIDDQTFPTGYHSQSYDCSLPVNRIYKCVNGTCNKMPAGGGDYCQPNDCTGLNCCPGRCQ